MSRHNGNDGGDGGEGGGIQYDPNDNHGSKLVDPTDLVEVQWCVYIFFSTAMQRKGIKDVLQLFSSEASAQSMTWLHQAELGTQLPSLHDNSDELHVTSGGEN